MITLSYLKQMLTYNCHVVLHHLYMSLYIPRDKIECYWFVFRGKGTVGEYHLSKLTSSMRAEPSNSPFDDPTLVRYMNVAGVCDILKMNESHKKEMMRFFAGYSVYIYFYIDPFFFQWREMLNNIEIGDDLFKAMAFTHVVTRAELVANIDPALFLKLRTSTMNEFRNTILQLVHGVDG